MVCWSNERAWLQAVRGLHRHFVDIVAIGIGVRLEIGRVDESEDAGIGIDLEEGAVCAADNAEDRELSIVRIVRGNNGNECRVLEHARNIGVAAARGDFRRKVLTGERNEADIHPIVGRAEEGVGKRGGV